MSQRVGLVSPGEMGSVLATEFREQGVEVVAYTGSRSARTREKAAAAGCIVSDDLRAIVSRCDLIVSVVPGEQATAVAGQVAAAIRATEQPAQLYLDLNSISPATATEVSGIVEAVGLFCVDGAVTGQAKRLTTSSTLLLSGRAAEDVRVLLPPSINARVVSQVAGDASGLKLSLSSLSKGLVTLYLETLAVASAAGQGEIAKELISAAYPAVVERVERQLVTYPHHAKRRQHELQELAAWAGTMEIDAPMARGSADVLETLASLRDKKLESPEEVVAGFAKAAKGSSRFRQ